MQAGLIDPDGDRPSGQGRAEPDLLASELQVPRRRDNPVGLHRQQRAPGWAARRNRLRWQQLSSIRVAGRCQVLPRWQPQLRRGGSRRGEPGDRRAARVALMYSGRAQPAAGRR